MAETFIREPIASGDNNAWAPYLLQQIRNTQGIQTSKLYDDSGTLKITSGIIGINDGTNQGTITISAAKTISLALCSASNWIAIEVSVSGTSVTFTATDIAGATNAAVLPATFKAAWTGVKGGFYLTATKRLIGIVWRNAAGTLEGIVNCLPFVDGWEGYGQSDDANDYKYIFEKDIEDEKEKEGNRIINENITFNGVIDGMHLFITNEQNNGVNGQTIDSTNWHSFNLNTVKQNDIVGASLSSNQITLPKGKYIINYKTVGIYTISGSFVFYRTRIRNITTNNTLIVGTYTVGGSDTTDKTGGGIIILTASNIIELQGYIYEYSAGSASWGRAYAGVAPEGTEKEVYGYIDIRKIG